MDGMVGQVESHGVVPDLHQIFHSLLLLQVDALVNLLSDGSKVHGLRDHLKCVITLVYKSKSQNETLSLTQD